MAKHPTRTYTEAEKERGLQAMAVCAGNRRLASRELAKQGFKIPAPTLGAWKDRYPERYQEIRADVLPQIRAEQSEQAHGLAHQIGEAMGKALDIYNKQVEEEGLTALEATRAVKDLGVPYGITSEKTLMWRGEAVAVVEHRLEESLAQLVRMGVIDLEGDDVLEIQDAELVEDTDDPSEPLRA